MRYEDQIQSLREARELLTNAICWLREARPDDNPHDALGPVFDRLDAVKSFVDGVRTDLVQKIDEHHANEIRDARAKGSK